jgi:hypothetical protein
MSSNETFEWTLERFPDLRLATNIVENPQSLLATIFGTPLEDIPTTLGPVATYDAVFDAAQHCVVSIEKALIHKAIETKRKVVETEEAKQRLLELALYAPGPQTESGSFWTFLRPSRPSLQPKDGLKLSIPLLLLSHLLQFRKQSLS